MANVSWSTSIQIAGGPTVTATQGPIAAEAIERIEVSIPPGGAEKVVSLHSGSRSDIHLMLIKSTAYGDGDSSKITFKVSDTEVSDTEEGENDEIVLSGPQLFSGGAVAFFGKDPRFLKFANNTGSPVQIEIFVARDATPSPAAPDVTPPAS